MARPIDTIVADFAAEKKAAASRGELWPTQRAYRLRQELHWAIQLKSRASLQVWVATFVGGVAAMGLSIGVIAEEGSKIDQLEAALYLALIPLIAWGASFLGRASAEGGLRKKYQEYLDF